MHIRELAMLSARLQRLEAAEYALLCSNIEAPAPSPNKETSKNSDEPKENEQIDSRELAAAFLNTQDALAHLHKIEAHLRRAYNRTWDRLKQMQKERRKLSPEEMRKRTHQWLSDEHERRTYSTANGEDDEPDDFPPQPNNPPTPPDRNQSPHPENLSDPPRKEPQSN